MTDHHGEWLVEDRWVEEKRECVIVGHQRCHVGDWSMWSFPEWDTLKKQR